MTGLCNTKGSEKTDDRIVVWQLDGKCPLGRCRHRRECDILMDFILRELKDVDWINLAQDKDHWRAVVHTIIQFEFHKTWGTT